MGGAGVVVDLALDLGAGLEVVVEGEVEDVVEPLAVGEVGGAGFIWIIFRVRVGGGGRVMIEDF